MSQPEELGPVPDELRELLEAEKSGGQPPGETRERVLLRLAGTFGLGQAGGLPPAEAPPASGAPPVLQGAALVPAAGAVRALAILLGGAAAGAGGYHVVERASRPAPISAPAPAPRTDESRPELEHAKKAESPAAPELPKAPVGPIRPRPPGTVETPAEVTKNPDDPLAAERSLLEMARAALARGQAERALAALRRHARQFPSGELTEEREGLLVQSLIGAQKYDQARERADQFKRRYPRSLFAPVIDQAIGSIP